MNLQTARLQWHPIAACTDLVPRHVFHAQLLGRELAVWRADDGHVNVWENRCLHRGVRLSIGINDGRELVCQYHGWRYANRTAGCTYIPAHPADAPARTICNNQYPVIEKNGLIWSCETDDPPAYPDIDVPAGEQLVLRAIPINATIDVVKEQLMQLVNEGFVSGELFKDEPGNGHPVSTKESSDPRLLHQDTFALSLLKESQVGTQQINFFLQPVDSHRTVVRGVLSGLPAGTGASKTEQLTILREHNQILKNLRERAETLMQLRETPQPWDAIIKPVSEALARMPDASHTAHSLLRVKVADIKNTATAIKSVELISIGDQLPTFQAGAHIDAHLPNGMVRQYSLTNAPGQTDRYIIGVKREADSSGGSSYIHENLKIDDVIAISVPRNNFPLRRDAVNTILVAGGIGITPMLSMAQALNHSSLPFQLHYFIQGNDHQAFSDLLVGFQSSLVIHIGLNPEQTESRLNEILQSYHPAHHVYICGPGPMLDVTREIAEKNRWPDDAVHFEYFKNTQVQDNSAPFKVSLARSGLTLDVPSGKSLLDVLRENNIDLPSSCEQGACGTCQVNVLSGEPLHQDVYLSRSERKRGNCMMTCVSRAKTTSLTLDI